jgi:hypothetical protein
MSPPLARLNDFSPNCNPSCCPQFGEGGGRFFQVGVIEHAELVR